MPSVTLYEQTDIPPGMTCDEYRRLHSATTHHRRLRLPWLGTILRW
ncbi:MAG TPA: hypothetical protein VF032_07565 [Thermoleophilaceae bacterium]